MTYEQFKDALTDAGNKHDGHVTHGSLEQQLKVIVKWVEQIAMEYERYQTGEPL